MAESSVPENIKRFIFEFIDSVEQLDVLLFMAADRSRYWNSQSLSRELRSNESSVQARLGRLQAQGLIEESSSVSKDYRYHPKNPEWAAAVTELAAIYAVRRHRILELVFSPVKQARVLSEAFRISPRKKNEGEENG